MTLSDGFDGVQRPRVEVGDDSGSQLEENGKCSQPHCLLYFGMCLHPEYSSRSLDPKVEARRRFGLSTQGEYAFVIVLPCWVLFHDNIDDLLEVNVRVYFRRVLGVFEEEARQVEDAVFQLPCSLEQDA